MKIVIVAALAAPLLLLGAATASADPPPDPQDPCAHNPTTLCDGTVRVVEEPPGENCVNGGVKITVQRGKLDGSEEPPALFEVPVDLDEPPGPPEDPPDEVFFVCNGPAGPAGAPGATGGTGTGNTGATGATGTTTIVTVPPKKVCQSSTRLGLRLFLPARLASFKRIQLTIRGPNTTNVRFNALVPVKSPRFGQGGRKFVFVPMRNRNCGAYTLVARRGKAAPIAALWTITGRFGLTRRAIAP